MTKLYRTSDYLLLVIEDSTRVLSRGDYYLLLKCMSEVKIGPLVVDKIETKLVRSRDEFEEDLVTVVFSAGGSIEELKYVRKCVAYYRLNPLANRLDLPLLPEFLKFNVPDNVDRDSYILGYKMSYFDYGYSESMIDDAVHSSSRTNSASEVDKSSEIKSSYKYPIDFHPRIEYSTPLGDRLSKDDYDTRLRMGIDVSNYSNIHFLTTNNNDSDELYLSGHYEKYY